MEKVSEGNPSIFHYLIFTGSPKTFDKLNYSLPGMFFSLDLLAHSS